MSAAPLPGLPWMVHISYPTYTTLSGKISGFKRNFVILRNQEFWDKIRILFCKIHTRKETVKYLALTRNKNDLPYFINLTEALYYKAI